MKSNHFTIALLEGKLIKIFSRHTVAADKNEVADVCMYIYINIEVCIASVDTIITKGVTLK